MSEPAAPKAPRSLEGTDEVDAALAPMSSEDPLEEDWPRAPTEAEWALLSDAERGAVVSHLEAWLSSGALDFMAEGPTHFENKTRSWDRLRRYFSRGGRHIYVAAELGVFYPGQKVIVPDVIAVLDRGPPQGNSWMVAIEGKGPDWALEIHVSGDRRKDVRGNVDRYASLGIAEYFVFDWNTKQLFGHRLPNPTARRYQRIPPRSGRIPSAVLGLDLAVIDGEVGFFNENAQLLGADELLGQLQRMVDEQSGKAQDEVESLRQQLQQAQAESQQAQAESQQAHSESRQAQDGLREALLAVFESRGIAVPAADRERIAGCADPGRLSRWLMRALAGVSLSDAIDREAPR